MDRQETCEIPHVPTGAVAGQPRIRPACRDFRDLSRNSNGTRSERAGMAGRE